MIFGGKQLEDGRTMQEKMTLSLALKPRRYCKEKHEEMPLQWSAPEQLLVPVNGTVLWHSDELQFTLPITRETTMAQLENRMSQQHPELSHFTNERWTNKHCTQHPVGIQLCVIVSSGEKR